LRAASAARRTWRTDTPRQAASTDFSQCTIHIALIRTTCIFLYTYSVISPSPLPRKRMQCITVVE
jgi:hypothetical protein